MFDALNYAVQIKWFRTRHSFAWDDCKVMIDFTRGYGYIIELEKMADEENKDKALDDLKKRLAELDIPLTSKEEFKKRFEEYKNNWRSLT